MKRFTLFFAACAALFCISCKKTDPDRIQFTVEGDGSFSRIELAESVNARLVISAPRKINGLTISMALGGFNSIANQHIGIEPNKGTEKRNSVFDLINDGKAIAYLQGLGIAAGAPLLSETSATLDIKKIIMALLEGQPVENDRSFAVSVEVEDQDGYKGNTDLSFHFTSAPEITWPQNAGFSTLNLDRQVRDPEGTELYKLSVKAPGKIASLVISLDESTADNNFSRWIVNRVTPVKPVIDLIEDPSASNEFKDWFPTRDALKGAEKATLNFLFVNKNLPDFSDKESLNTFTITVTDRFGKKAEVQARFHVPAKTSL